LRLAARFEAARQGDLAQTCPHPLRPKRTWLARGAALAGRRCGEAPGDVSRFPLAVATVAKLPAKSCLIDGGAIVCDPNGLAVFKLSAGTGTART
jgi:hypothetical protein